MWELFDYSKEHKRPRGFWAWYGEIAMNLSALALTLMVLCSFCYGGIQIASAIISSVVNLKITEDCINTFLIGFGLVTFAVGIFKMGEKFL